MPRGDAAGDFVSVKKRRYVRLSVGAGDGAAKRRDADDALRRPLRQRCTPAAGQETRRCKFVPGWVLRICIGVFVVVILCRRPPMAAPARVDGRGCGSRRRDEPCSSASPKRRRLPQANPAHQPRTDRLLTHPMHAAHTRTSDACPYAGV